MREKGDISSLRSRYRHQSTRRSHEGTIGSRQVLAKRPHAMPKQAVDGLVTVPVKRAAVRKSPQPRLVKTALLIPNKPSSTDYPKRIKRSKMPAPKERPVQRSYVLKRETVARPEQKKKIPLKERAKQPQTMLVVAGVMVFVFGITVSIMGMKTNQQVGAQAAAPRSTVHTDENPDEKDPGPNAVRSYKVAPDMPRRISVAKIGVNARIRAMGVKSDNQLMAPTSIYDAGWYQQSAKPGQNGAMLIDGHVSGRTRPGVFKKLDRLVAGDRITVERGDGQVFNYKVVKTQKYPKSAVDMTAAITPVVAGKQGLNLITCTGPLGAGATGYSERLVVFTVRE